MQESAEIRDVVLRYFDLLAAGDAEAIANLHSRSPGVATLGVDAGPWLIGHDQIAEAFRTQMQGHESYPVLTPVDLHCYVEGNVGWAYDQPKLTLSDGREMTFRMTTVFVKEDGEWRVAVGHASFPAAGPA